MGFECADEFAGALVGSHPWKNEALERTGAKIIAVERNHDVLIEFADDFRLQNDDALYVCGSLNALARCQRDFQASPITIRH